MLSAPLKIERLGKVASANPLSDGFTSSETAAQTFSKARGETAVTGVVRDDKAPAHCGIVPAAK